MKTTVAAVSVSLLAVDVIGAAAGSLRQRRFHASHTLEFSGAIVSVEEDYRHVWPAAQRTFVLEGANGRTVLLQLHAGGGNAGNDSLNLYKETGQEYFLVSERDCVEFDPVKVRAKACAIRSTCHAGNGVGLEYLGRFDWMNGFDPPLGRFELRFRFLSREDAAEGGSCLHR